MQLQTSSRPNSLLASQDADCQVYFTVGRPEKEHPLSRFCRTCWCNLNLYFWGELFLTLWPCHAHWTLTMTDLSAAFLLGSLAHEWATGREPLWRHDHSGFLWLWVKRRPLSWRTQEEDFTLYANRCTKDTANNILFAGDWGDCHGNPSVQHLKQVHISAQRSLRLSKNIFVFQTAIVLIM